MMTCIISKYLQQYIIKLIITSINKYKKQFVYFSTLKRDDDLFIGRLIKVNSLWFECVSTYLNVLSFIENVHCKCNKYSVLKNENIKYICLTTFINVTLDRYINLKRIIYDNRSNIKQSCQLLETLNIPLRKQYKLSIRYYSFPQQQKLSKKFDLDKIYHLEVTLQNHNFLELYEQLISLKKVDYITSTGKTFQTILNKIKSLNNIVVNNYFSKLKGYISCNSGYTIQHLYDLLKLSSNLDLLSISLCFDNLIYQFERINNPNTNSIPCNMCNNDNDKQNEVTFLAQWQFICKTIRNHNQLKQFQLSNYCPKDDFGFLIGQFQKYPCIPSFAIEQIAKLFISNKSIKNLTIDHFHTPQLIESMYKDSQNSNKTIETIHSKIRNLSSINKNQFDVLLTNVIINNPQINEIFIEEEDEEGCATTNSEIFVFIKSQQ